MHTVSWDAEKTAVKLIDQRRLPASLEWVFCTTAAATAEAIRNMTVRGAPAIGITAAFGLAVEACRLSASAAPSASDFQTALETADDLLRASRPTAVNLAWVLDRLRPLWVESGVPPAAIAARLLNEALKMASEDIAINRQMAFYGASLIDDGDTIIHHCNTGALAAVDWGTALGCLRMAHEQGKKIHVLVDETRPRLQGARLTAWELTQWGIPFDIISDNMAGYFLRKGEVQKVFFGADRVAANGDVANKIGTYMLSLAAHANHVPVYAVLPTSTIDHSLPDGSLIPIEERDPREVLSIQLNGEMVVPQGATARNPAFDVTPHHLLSGIVTEAGILRPPFGRAIAQIFHHGESAP